MKEKRGAKPFDDLKELVLSLLSGEQSPMERDNKHPSRSILSEIPSEEDRLTRDRQPSLGSNYKEEFAYFQLPQKQEEILYLREFVLLCECKQIYVDEALIAQEVKRRPDPTSPLAAPR